MAVLLKGLTGNAGGQSSSEGRSVVVRSSPDRATLKGRVQMVNIG